MNDRQQDVLRKLRQFRIDDEHGGRPDLTFAQRLARENRWSVVYAERVVDEYKRFAFLACFAGHPVTPSDQVDQAWHLHMTYTRSYWDRFCTQVLGRPLHHDPTRGGAGEDAKFDDWYARTLESYQGVFGDEPPADIWPPSSVRFNPHQRWVRIDAGRHWLIPRVRIGRAAAATALLATPIAAAGCTPNNWPPTIFIVAIVSVIAFTLIVNIIRGYRGNSGPHNRSDHTGVTPGGCGSGCGGGGLGWWWFGGGDSSSSSSSSDSDGGDSGRDGGSGCGSSGCGGGGCGGGGD